jgi:hypothetical protein
MNSTVMNPMNSDKTFFPNPARGLSETFGDHLLCAWRTGPNSVRIQTKLPDHARRLSQRQDGRLVAFSVQGEYLRIFQFDHPIGWARRLIERYIRSGTPTNERFSDSVCPRSDSDDAGDSRQGTGSCNAPAVNGGDDHREEVA